MVKRYLLSKNIMYPKNKEEWWAILNEHWQNIHTIIERFVDEDKLLNLEELRQNEDPKLDNILQEAWWNAPDNKTIFKLPSWLVLCDLCSENHVLYDDK